jgi:hypothetical protein
MTNCWTVIYAVPRGTLNTTAVSVNEDGSCWEEGFFWIALEDDYVAGRRGNRLARTIKIPRRKSHCQPRRPIHGHSKLVQHIIQHTAENLHHNLYIRVLDKIHVCPTFGAMLEK